MLALRHQCVVSLAKSRAPMDPMIDDVLYEIGEIKKNIIQVNDNHTEELSTIHNNLNSLFKESPVDTLYYFEILRRLYEEIFEHWHPTDQDENHDYFVTLYRAVAVNVNVSAVSDVTKLCDTFKYYDIIPKPLDLLEHDRISIMFAELKSEHELLVKAIGDPMEFIRSRQNKMVELRVREREINNEIYRHQMILNDIRFVDQWVMLCQLDNMEL